MARVVVLSTAEIERSALGDVVRPDDEVVVIVSAVEQSRLDWLTNDDGDARARARDVADAIDRNAPTEPSEVEVRTDAPRQLVLDAIAEHDPDLVVVALRDGEDASWLERSDSDEIPSEIDGVPVTRVEL